MHPVLQWDNKCVSRAQGWWAQVLREHTEQGFCVYVVCDAMWWRCEIESGCQLHWRRDNGNQKYILYLYAYTKTVSWLIQMQYWVSWSASYSVRIFLSVHVPQHYRVLLSGTLPVAESAFRLAVQWTDGQFGASLCIHYVLIVVNNIPHRHTYNNNYMCTITTVLYSGHDRHCCNLLFNRVQYSTVEMVTIQQGQQVRTYLHASATICFQA